MRLTPLFLTPTLEGAVFLEKFSELFIYNQKTNFM